MGGQVHGACTVRNFGGNYVAFTPKIDLHKKALDSNIGSKKTTMKSSSDPFLMISTSSLQPNALQDIRTTHNK